MTIFRFFVLGTPKPQPRPRARAMCVGAKWIAQIYNPKASNRWREAIQKAGAEHRPERRWCFAWTCWRVFLFGFTLGVFL